MRWSTLQEGTNMHTKWVHIITANKAKHPSQWVVCQH